MTYHCKYHNDCGYVVISDHAYMGTCVHDVCDYYQVESLTTNEDNFELKMMAVMKTMKQQHEEELDHEKYMEQKNYDL